MRHFDSIFHATVFSQGAFQNQFVRHITRNPELLLRDVPNVLGDTQQRYAELISLDSTTPYKRLQLRGSDMKQVFIQADHALQMSRLSSWMEFVSGWMVSSRQSPRHQPKPRSFRIPGAQSKVCVSFADTSSSPS